MVAARGSRRPSRSYRSAGVDSRTRKACVTRKRSSPSPPREPHAARATHNETDAAGSNESCDVESDGSNWTTGTRTGG